MSRLELQFGKRRTRTTTVLTAGIHALVGPDEAAADALVRAVAGVRRERHEDVFVDGARPSGNPGLRRHIGALFRREEAPEAESVESFVRTALSLRGSPITPRDVVEKVGFGDVLSRAPRSLSASESRALALAVALSIEEPKVLALFEPLSTGLDRALIVDRLSAHAASGAVVLCRTSSSVDAADIGATGIVVQDDGRTFRTAPDLVPWFSAACVVTTDAPRRLSGALSEDAAVSSVTWNEELASGELSVTGPDAEGTALAILRAAAHSGAVLYSVRRVPAERRSAPAAAPQGNP